MRDEDISTTCPDPATVILRRSCFCWILSEVQMVKKKAAKKTPGRKKKVKSQKTVIRRMKPEKEEKKKTKVKFKSVMPREEAISYFEAIVAGLKRGSIQIRQG